MKKDMYMSTFEYIPVGPRVGPCVGPEVGWLLGDELGVVLGEAEGEADGDELGLRLGLLLGSADGSVLGEALGIDEGVEVGPCVGPAAWGKMQRRGRGKTWLALKMLARNDSAVFNSQRTCRTKTTRQSDRWRKGVVNVSSRRPVQSIFSSCRDRKRIARSDE